MNANSDGTPAIEVMFEDKDGDGTSDAGTISGAQLASSLNDLNKKVTDLQTSCISLDGMYFYSFGGGATVRVKEDLDLVFVDLLEAAEVWEVGRVC